MSVCRAPVVRALALFSLFALAPAPALADVPIRVAAWNVESVSQPGGAEYDATVAVLGRIDADVVLINEVNGSADADAFAVLAVDTGYGHVVLGPGGPFGSLANAVMSRLPLTSSTVHTSADLSADAGADDITRHLIEAVVDVPGGVPLTVIALHAKSGTANSDEFRRVVEMTRAAQALAGQAAHGAYLVGGDINEELDSVPRSPLFFEALPTGLPTSFSLGADLAAQMASGGLYNDPFAPLTAVDGPAMSVLPALQPDGDDGTRPASGRRLDYLFASSVLAGTAQTEVYDCADEGLGGLPKAGAPLPAATCAAAADHLPVLADVSVPSDGCAVDADCDDGLFCSGTEACVDGGCVPGADPCAADETCDEAADACVFDPCDDDGICEAGEDCGNCGDCGAGAGASCGDGVCHPDAGEDCTTCPADCAGKTDGKPSRRFCCGADVGCGDARCTDGGAQCEAGAPPAWCCGDGLCADPEQALCAVDCGAPPACGDGTCDAGEDPCTCAADCGDAPLVEAVCDDGIDGDCDGAVDCDDADCGCGSPCDGDGVCQAGEDCGNCADCAGRTGGKPANRFCCGDGVVDAAEGDGAICDGRY